MANYRAGDVIRLTRNMIGMTQEELSDGICSVETLSRIENGRHHIKHEVYKEMMRKMGRGIHDNCVICMGRDMSMIEEYAQFEDAMVKREFNTARRYLEHIRGKISDSLSDRQYLARVQPLLDYKTGKMDARAYMLHLDAAMKLTIPDYERYLWGNQQDTVYPYREQEILILMSIGNTYCDLHEMEKSIIVYETILRSLDAGYMDRKNAEELKLLNLANLSRTLGKLERYEEALEKAGEGLEIAVRRRYAHGLVELLMQTAGNKLKLILKSENPDGRERELANVKKVMRQAYYIAAARKDQYNQNLINQNLEYHFGDPIQ